MQHTVPSSTVGRLASIGPLLISGLYLRLQTAVLLKLWGKHLSFLIGLLKAPPSKFDVKGRGRCPTSSLQGR